MTVTPVDVNPDDLALYLGAAVEDDRAQLMLDLALAACAALVDPVSDACKGVVLSAAARAYTSPVQRGAETIGPYSVGGIAGGVTLTRAERQQLRRLSGGGSAFTVSMIGDEAGSGLLPWDYTDTGDITPDDVA